MCVLLDFFKHDTITQCTKNTEIEEVKIQNYNKQLRLCIKYQLFSRKMKNIYI